MLGWDLQGAWERPFFEKVAPGWEEAAAASYQAVMEEPATVHSIRMDFLDGGGVPRPLEINVLAKVEDGVIVGINGVARDISERLRLERELSHSEERFRYLVQNSPDIVFSTDAEGGSRSCPTPSSVSPAIARPMSSGSTSRSWSTSPADRSPAIAGPISSPIRRANSRRPSFSWGRTAGVPVDVRAIGVLDGDGEFAGIQGATRDVSDQVRLENELRRPGR